MDKFHFTTMEQKCIGIINRCPPVFDISHYRTSYKSHVHSQLVRFASDRMQPDQKKLAHFAQCLVLCPCFYRTRFISFDNFNNIFIPIFQHPIFKVCFVWIRASLHQCQVCLVNFAAGKQFTHSLLSFRGFSTYQSTAYRTV